MKTRYDANNNAHSLAQGTHNPNAREQRSVGLPPVLHRYVVLETINDPTRIDIARIEYWEHELGLKNGKIGLNLPRNSILAQRVLDGTAPSADPPMLLYPLMPSHIAVPCKPGEHVWVMFENLDAQYSDVGYWMWKIVSPGHVDDVNHTHAPRAFDQSFIQSSKDAFDGQTPTYEFRNGLVQVDNDGTRYSRGSSQFIPGNEDAYEKLMTDSDSSKNSVLEPVPRFVKRADDVTLEGSNNSLIVLGTNRKAQAADWAPDSDGVMRATKTGDDLEPKCGTIDLVVGRVIKGTPAKSKKLDGSNFAEEIEKSPSLVDKTEGDLDYANDAARVFANQRSKIDELFDITRISKEVSDSSTGDSSAGMKGDKVRLIARKDIVLTVQNNSTDPADWASLIISTSGNIICIPSKTGLILMGGEDATLSPLCSTGINAGGIISAPPIINTMGGQNGAGGSNGQFPTKVLFK
jgi:hypothetical protein